MTAYGLGGTGATLAARWRLAPQLIITNEDTGFAGQCRLYVIGPNPDDPIEPGLLGIVGFHPRFPYGFPVEPDVPL